jgi:hypothetical protein
MYGLSRWDDLLIGERRRETFSLLRLQSKAMNTELLQKYQPELVSVVQEWLHSKGIIEEGKRLRGIVLSFEKMEQAMILVEENKVTAPTGELDTLLCRPASYLGLSSRARNRLNGVTVGMLARLNDVQVYGFKGLGKGFRHELQEKLAKKGLSLGGVYPLGNLERELLLNLGIESKEVLVCLGQFGWAGPRFIILCEKAGINTYRQIVEMGVDRLWEKLREHDLDSILVHGEGLRRVILGILRYVRSS